MADEDLDRPGMEGHPVGGRSARRSFIVGQAPATILGTAACLAAAFYLWPFAALTASPADLAFQWLFVSMLPYGAVCLVIHADRLREGSHNPLAGAESEHLKIHCRVMQNTLEQLIWFACCLLPLSTVLAPGEFHAIPILACGFVLARLAYWRGYFTDGTLGRRYGVQMTLTINGGLLVGTGLLLLLR